MFATVFQTLEPIGVELSRYKEISACKVIRLVALPFFGKCQLFRRGVHFSARKVDRSRVPLLKSNPIDNRK